MVDIMYGQGISQVGELVDMGADADVITKAGAWYSYGEERLGQGRENAKEFLEENLEIRKEIDRKVRLAYGVIDEEEFERLQQLAAERAEQASELEVDEEIEETEDNTSADE